MVYLYGGLKFNGKKRHAKTLQFSHKGLDKSAHIANRNICYSTPEL